MSIPNRTWFDPLVGATLHTGANALDAGMRMPHGELMAADIETPGLNTFEMNAITCAWKELDGRIHSILLDPREAIHLQLFRDMVSSCSQVVFHNSAFDVPILWHHRLLDRKGVSKVTDTLIHARVGYPDPYIPKSLEKLAQAHLGLDELAGGMLRSFKAAGYKTKQAGYEGMTIDSPIYRLGAMVDTVVTLQLEPILRDRAVHWLTNHPFQVGGATTSGEALRILETQHIVNRVMLRRSAVGLAVDPEYLAKYSESVDLDKQRAIALLAQHSDDKGPLVGGASKGGRIVEYLDSINALPANWPRSSKTRKLRATKDDLDNLDHPLAQAQRTLAQIEKIEQYITKVQTQYETTGRCHPQVAILGASPSGRMSVSGPEYHQFSETDHFRRRPGIDLDRLVPDRTGHHGVDGEGPRVPRTVRGRIRSLRTHPTGLWDRERYGQDRIARSHVWPVGAIAGHGPGSHHGVGCAASSPVVCSHARVREVDGQGNRGCRNLPTGSTRRGSNPPRYRGRFV